MQRRCPPELSMEAGLALSERHFVRLAQAGNLLADRLLAVLQPTGQLPLDERVEPPLVGPGAEPVTGLLTVALEVAVCKALASLAADLAEVLDPVSLLDDTIKLQILNIVRLVVDLVTFLDSGHDGPEGVGRHAIHGD